MRRTVVQRYDDLTGEEIGPDTAATLFGIDDQHYEIDLSERNGAELRDVLARYVEHGRKVGKASRAPSGKPVDRYSEMLASTGVSRAVIKSWGAENGFEIADRGRLPLALMHAYAEAHQADVADTAHRRKMADARARHAEEDRAKSGKGKSNGSSTEPETDDQTSPAKANRLNRWFLTRHAQDRMNIRGYEPGEVQLAAESPETTYPGANDSVRIHRRGVVGAVVNPDQLAILTVLHMHPGEFDYGAHRTEIEAGMADSVADSVAV